MRERERESVCVHMCVCGFVCVYTSVCLFKSLRRWDPLVYEYIHEKNSRLHILLLVQETETHYGDIEEQHKLLLTTQYT